MATNIHLYANGNDPFIFPLGDFIVHVHAGAPPEEPSTATSPAPEPDLAPITPRLTVYPRKTPVGPPIGLIHIEGVGEMQNWFNSIEMEPGDQPVQFRLDTMSGPSRLGIDTLLGGLQSFSDLDRGVNVDIVGWSEPGDG